MNLKQIDAAVSAYHDTLDQSDEARLTFFRALWDVQNAVATEDTSAPAYEVPSDDDLRTWFMDSEPVFSQAPVTLTNEGVTDALTRVVECLVEQGGFPTSVQEAFSRTKWDRMVAASDIELAGSNPVAYVESFGDLLTDDGMDEEAAYTGMLALSLALRALLEAPAAQVSAALKKAGISEPHPRCCPVCGGEPTAARVGDTEAVQGRGKELWCAQCGTTWDYERVRCARCGTQNQSHLHYFNVEGDDAHRIATCDECGGYMRTVYQQDALAPFSFDVEDVVMARLDAIALDPSFAGGEQSETE